MLFDFSIKRYISGSFGKKTISRADGNPIAKT